MVVATNNLTPARETKAFDRLRLSGNLRFIRLSPVMS